MKEIESYIEDNKELFLEDLFSLLRIKSVSTDSAYNQDVENCALFLKKHLQQIGLKDTEIIETQGHPIVYSSFIVSKDLPTILLYGHYDVQPADPYELWDSDPFEPVLKNDYIISRGVSDDKGQFFAHIKAIETFLAVTKTLPVNIKIIIEGEEEIGSKNLKAFLNDYKRNLSADVAVISDTPMLSKSQPAICFSLRGMVYAEIKLKGPNRDLHSGQYGGIVQNPIQALSKIIAGLKNEDDKVTIPGFYDDVSSASAEELLSLSKLPIDNNAYLEDLGISEFVMDSIDIPTQLWMQPTLDCNGIVGGYIHEGAKTIIPSEASAKISMRLVANQDPQKILEQFTTYLDSLKPKGVELEIIVHNLARPAKMNTSSGFVKAASMAYESTFNARPLLVGEGGTIPVVADFKEVLGIDTVMMGFNCPDDCIHSPNERLLLDSFYTIYGNGGGVNVHNHISEIDEDPIINLSSKKYSLVYYLSVGDQDCTQPGILKLFDPEEDVLPSEGMIIIFPADRYHSAAYNGSKDRIIIGINFFVM